jgi:diguanylate cyclase (GGDEF)-like protein
MSDFAIKAFIRSSDLFSVQQSAQENSSAVEAVHPAAKSPRRPGHPRPRMTLSRRLTLALVTMATLSTTLAVVAQDRALARDLEAAAAARLDRSTSAGGRVVAEHLSALSERYRAVARTPQLRATLELLDQPTLVFLADELARQQGASAIAFVDPDGEVLASSGKQDLLSIVPEEEGAQLRASPLDASLYAVARIALETRGVSSGAFIAFERIGEERLDRWSDLCGAAISVEFDDDPREKRDGLLVREIMRLESAALTASSGLEAERAAVDHARVELLRAGGLALAVSILGCFALARSLVRPIQEIQRAIERIRTGELTRPLHSARTDEIGDVARGIDRMSIDLLASRHELNLRIEELDLSQTHLANAQKIARIGSLEIDLQSGVITGSHEFFALMGFENRSASEKTDVEELMLRVHEADREGVRDTLEESVRSGVAARIDHRVVVGSSERVMHTQLQVVCGDDGGAERLEGTVQDVTERRRAEKQIRFLAYHDSLTGLGNRLHFKERLEIEVQQARRRKGRIGIIFFDLDHFKRINDTLGHSVGDQLLQGVADRIVEALSESEGLARGGEPIKDMLISRVGGDEFTLMLSHMQDPTALAAVARRILDAMSEPFVLEGHEIVVGASAGLAAWPENGDDAETVLRNADSAMYHAKSSGRNTYKYYEESMNAAAMYRLNIETRLRHAIDNDEVDVFYQPRVEIASGRVVGFEALARWHDSELGSVSPGEFIPIAEKTGLIAPLGRYILRTACRQAAEWESSEAAFDGRISVNVSARQFKLVDVAREVAEALADSRVNPLRLEIEVTESVILHDADRVVETLHSIREMGVRIALDDFGTGYSSLSYLRRLPVDVLKIDMSFIRGIARSHEDAALARAIIAMADALGLSVVAEGVETLEQRTLLCGWGCAEMQGFLASPAIRAEEAFDWIGRES